MSLTAPPRTIRACLPSSIGFVLLAGSFITLATAGGLDAQSADRSVARLGFLAGCWAGTMGSLDMREQWTEVEGGVMLGTTRYFRDGVLADFEFALIVEDSGVATLWPYPKGERSAHGFPLVAAGEEYVFENLEHDFPVRIVYAREGETTLNPRAEGADGQGPRWSLSRVPCPDGSPTSGPSGTAAKGLAR